MIGDSLKISPDMSYLDRDLYYFPEKGAQWCPVWEGAYLQCFTGASYQSISIPVSEIFLHMRSATILPIQLSDSTQFSKIKNISNLNDLATKYRTDLAILLDGDLKANGDVRFDGGVTTDLTKYDEIKFTAVGDKPFFENNYIEVVFNLTNNKSEGNSTLSQQVGDIIIHDANEMEFLLIEYLKLFFYYF